MSAASPYSQPDLPVPPAALERIHDLYGRREILEFTFGPEHFEQLVDRALTSIALSDQQRSWLLDNMKKIHEV